MARLGFDLEFSKAMSRAKSDPDAAAECMLIIATRLRAIREQMPEIVDFLSGAIEASMNKAREHRLAAFGRELNLTAGNRRPVNVDSYAVGRAFDALIDAGQSQNAVATQVAADFGISESTAVRLWKEHRKLEEKIERIRYDEENDG